MASLRVLLDTNVVLDLLLRREPWLAEAQPFWEARDAGQLVAHVPAVALTNIFYIGRRQIGTARALDGLRFCLANFTILPVDRAMAERALALAGNDFEDNVQIACAIEAGLDLIVTRDPDGFAHAPIRAVAPPNVPGLAPPP